MKNNKDEIKIKYIPLKDDNKKLDSAFNLLFESEDFMQETNQKTTSFKQYYFKKLPFTETLKTEARFDK